MLLKKSISSEKKATGEIPLLQEDKAKLCHDIDLLKEKNAGWNRRRSWRSSAWNRRRSSSMKMLQALVMEQEELAKLRIEHPAAVKVCNAAVE